MLSKEQFPFELKPKQYQETYHGILPLNLMKKKNQYQYTQFQKATDIIVVFHGECALKSNPKITNEKELLSNRDKLQTINIINRGGIAGLESAKGEDTLYESNLFVVRDFTVIYRISMNVLSTVDKNDRKEIKDFFLNMYNQQTKLLLKHRSNYSITALPLSDKNQKDDTNVFNNVVNQIVTEKENHKSMKSLIRFNHNDKKEIAYPKMNERLISHLSSTKSRNVNNNWILTTETNASHSKIETVSNRTYLYSTGNKIKSKLYLYKHRSKKPKSIVIDSNIMNTLKQMSKINVYNSGYFKMPMIHNKLK